MIRVIVHIAKAAIAAITALLFVSCNLGYKTIEGNGKVTTETRPHNNYFNSIDVSNALEVVIEQGTPFTITVEADSNLQSNIITEIDGSTLKIYTKDNLDGTNKIYVRLPVIQQITASGASSVENKNAFTAENIKLGVSGASEISIALEGQSADIEASGASSVKISGRADKLSCDASGSSDINAEKLLAKNVSADASGASSVHVNPTESLTADASGSSEITYKNTPGKLVKNATGASDIFQN